MTAPALPAATPRRAALVPIAALAALLALVGVLAFPHHATRAHTAAVPNMNTLVDGQTLQQARCSNWLHASAGQRAAAVQSLAAIVGAPTEYKGVHGTALTKQQSYNLLNNACSAPIARNFLLYELYIRAAAFSSLAPATPN
jgi:hypothetical protein